MDVVIEVTSDTTTYDYKLKTIPVTNRKPIWTDVESPDTYEDIKFLFESPKASSSSCAMKLDILDRMRNFTVDEVNQIFSLSFSILLAAMLQTVHCFTLYMNEHLKNISF